MVSDSRGVGAKLGLLEYLRATTNLFTGLVLILPVFVIYQTGVIIQLATSTSGSFSINGADYLTATILRICNGSLVAYIIFVLGVSLGFAMVLLTLSRKDTLAKQVMLPMIGESIIYALLFASTIHFIQALPQLLTVNSHQLASVAGPRTAWDMFFQSFGAGFNEELMFRLGLLGGTTFLGRLAGLPKLFSLIFAFLLSSLSFSAFHYIGPYAESFVFDSFMYRFFAGILLGTLFWWRGLAVAVYTHAFYDVYFFFALS